MEAHLEDTPVKPLAIERDVQGVTQRVPRRLNAFPRRVTSVRVRSPPSTNDGVPRETGGELAACWARPIER